MAQMNTTIKVKLTDLEIGRKMIHVFKALEGADLAELRERVMMLKLDQRPSDELTDFLDRALDLIEGEGIGT